MTTGNGTNGDSRAGGGAPLADLSSRVARVAAPLREQVLDLLRTEIVELRLRPGQRLVERELVERTGVSRTTIREVLRQLSAEGLVTTIPQKGAVVASPSAREAAEVYEIRALLEGAAAREFALRGSPAQVRALRTALEAVELSVKHDDPVRAMLTAKDELFDILLEGAANGTIKSILASLQARVAVLRSTTMSVPGRPEESVEEIRTLVEAIERRDADAAANAASFHVRQAARTLFAQLEPGSDIDVLDMINGEAGTPEKGYAGRSLWTTRSPESTGVPTGQST